MRLPMSLGINEVPVAVPVSLEAPEYIYILPAEEDLGAVLGHTSLLDAE